MHRPIKLYVIIDGIKMLDQGRVFCTISYVHSAWQWCWINFSVCRSRSISNHVGLPDAHTVPMGLIVIMLEETFIVICTSWFWVTMYFCQLPRSDSNYHNSIHIKRDVCKLCVWVENTALSTNQIMIIRHVSLVNNV